MGLDETPEKDEPEQPPLKRRRSASTNPIETKLPQKMLSKKMAGMMEGRENVPPSATTGRRYLRTRPSD
jgi:kinesin family protein 11